MKLQITYLPTEGLKPYEKNPRKNKKAVEIVKKSIQAFGFKNPIIIDKENVIIAGHTRLEAAKQLSLTEVPVIYAEDLTPEQVNAFRIMDNKSNEYADWDMDTLKEELKKLQDVNFDLELTGFSEAELNKLAPNNLEEKELPDPEKPKYEVKRGEVYQLGNHRLMCGDSTNTEDVNKLMNGQKADMIFTDPPYGISYRSESDKNFEDIKNDEYDLEKLNEFLKNSFTQMDAIMKDGACIYVWHSDMKGDIKPTFERRFLEFFELSATIIWIKNVASMGWQDYRRQHEPCLYGWKKSKSHKFYGDRTQTTTWFVNRDATGKYEHPTQKPVELAKKGIINSSKEGDLIVDLFGGAGFTLIASHQLNRNCNIMELDEKYCSVIMERFENLTGIKPTKVTP